MGQVININFNQSLNKEFSDYKEKLIRIRDDIEAHLHHETLKEGDELAVALAAGRYATMKLVQLTGEGETLNFLNECIKTSLKF